VQYNYCETEHVFAYDSHVARVRPSGSTEFSHPLHTPCCCRNQPGNRPDCIHNYTDTLHCLEAQACQLFFVIGTEKQARCISGAAALFFRCTAAGWLVSGGDFSVGGWAR